MLMNWGSSVCVATCKAISHNVVFSWFILGAILLAGALVGIQSYPKMAQLKSLDSLNTAVQSAFTIDLILRIFSEGIRPWNFW
jgi:hypothetical protein